MNELLNGPRIMASLKLHLARKECLAEGMQTHIRRVQTSFRCCRGKPTNLSTGPAAAYLFRDSRSAAVIYVKTPIAILIVLFNHSGMPGFSVPK